jgi:hypothetical protein
MRHRSYTTMLHSMSNAERHRRHAHGQAHRILQPGSLADGGPLLDQPLQGGKATRGHWTCAAMNVARDFSWFPGGN